jgi:hypothetical protein
MQRSDSDNQGSLTAFRTAKPIHAAAGCGSPSLTPRATVDPGKGRAPDVFVFNPFTEHSIARGAAFTPVKHQALLAEDLANLPQFLCQAGDIVLLAKRPSPDFQRTLRNAGFPQPEFLELKAGRIDPAADLCRQGIGKLRPWAWGPDSVELLEPLFARVIGASQSGKSHFNDEIAQLYSKAWMTTLLRTVLPCCRKSHLASLRTGSQSGADQDPSNHWLCSEQELGRVVTTLEDALEAIAAIRSRGHHRVVVKEAYGLAGRNMIRLWEPELLPAQRRWLTRALGDSGALVVEPWLERASDFSLQLEMGPHNLQLCGYTGLVNDGRGQFLASWAEPNHDRQVPASVAALLRGPADSDGRLQRLYVELLARLEPELQRAGFVGPISIDALIYRNSKGECRLRPVVEINPRYTMGRLTVELMKMVCPESRGLFRLLTQSQVRAAGFSDFPSYSASLSKRRPLRFEGEPLARIRQGALCLNDPGQAQVCLATFEVSPNQPLTGGLDDLERSPM